MGARRGGRVLLPRESPGDAEDGLPPRVVEAVPRRAEGRELSVLRSGSRMLARKSSVRRLPVG